MEMIIIWAVVIAVALVIEAFSTDFFSICFAGGGIVSLILAATGVDLYWQIGSFFVIAVLLVVFVRPLLKKAIIKKTIPTNMDMNLNKKVKLLEDVVEGRSTVKINGVVWNAVCETPLKKDDTVTIVNLDGNKIIVKGE